MAETAVKIGEAPVPEPCDAARLQDPARCFDYVRMEGVLVRIQKDDIDPSTRRFKSRDLHSAANLMAKNRKREERLDLLDAVDEAAVTGMLMDILNLWNRDDQTVEVTERHVKDIRDWLERLDLIATCRVRRSDGSDDVQRTIFTQPGMRYCQAQALVFAIGADSRMRQFGEGLMFMVCETILNDVRGRTAAKSRS